jgi:hypothetical protein
VAVLAAAVLPRLVRDRTPHGSDRRLPPPDASTNGHGGAPGGTTSPPAVQDTV